jgi:hypothetical protein
MARFFMSLSKVPCLRQNGQTENPKKPAAFAERSALAAKADAKPSAAAATRA